MLGLLVASSPIVACDVVDEADEQLLEREQLEDERPEDEPLVLGAPWVEIVANLDGPRLRWSTRPGATYSVYRSSEEWTEFWTGVRPNPEFQVSDPGVVLLADGLTQGAHLDYAPLDLGDPFYPSGAFYRVVEHTAEGDAVSAPVGRIARHYWHTSAYAPHEPLLDNKIPVCLDPTPADADRRALLGGVATSVSWWDPPTQSYHFDGPPFMAVLELGLGSVFSLRPPASFDHSPLDDFYQLTGRVPESNELVTGVYEGNNAVVWPVTAPPTTASALLEGPGHMQHATAVGVWNTHGRMVRWYPELPAGDLPGVDEAVAGDFPIDPCSPLYLYIDAGEPEGTELGDLIGLTWPPALADAP